MFIVCVRWLSFVVETYCFLLRIAVSRWLMVFARSVLFVVDVCCFGLLSVCGVCCSLLVGRCWLLAFVAFDSCLLFVTRGFSVVN